MHGHLVLLAAFFVESQPPASAIMIVVVDLELVKKYGGESLRRFHSPIGLKTHSAFRGFRHR